MLFFVVVFIKSIIMFICVALAVGFFTLMERKVLSYIQTRKGPNKVGFMGLPQPLTDALKLFVKESVGVDKSNKFFYVLGPLMASSIMFSIWALYCSWSSVFFKLGILYFFAVSSLNVYSVLLSGWSSNSKYSLLGAIRAVAQTISYEVSMMLIIIGVVMVSLSYNLFDINCSQYGWYTFFLFPVFVMWLVSILAETNRAPFDLAEGESELVSGFNIEYGGGQFALLFMCANKVFCFD